MSFPSWNLLFSQFPQSFFHFRKRHVVCDPHPAESRRQDETKLSSLDLFVQKHVSNHTAQIETQPIQTGRKTGSFNQLILPHFVGGADPAPVSRKPGGRRHAESHGLAVPEAPVILGGLKGVTEGVAGI